MANVDVFDFYHSPEQSFLEILADELAGTFHCIAHAGYASNKKFISDRQKYFEMRFGPFIGNVLSDIGIFNIIPAYECLGFMSGNSPDEIRQYAEEGLSYLEFGGEVCEEQESAFEGFR